MLRKTAGDGLRHADLWSVGRRYQHIGSNDPLIAVGPLRYHSRIMKQAQNVRALSLPDLVARTLRKDVLEMCAYHVPDAAGMVKLDAMENPYSLPASLREELGQLAANAPLNRYPDPEASRLRSALRASMQVPDGMELLLGNGSDELIQLLALACARPGTTMLGLEPSFAMYAIVARACGLKFLGIPLGRDFSLDTRAVVAALRFFEEEKHLLQAQLKIRRLHKLPDCNILQNICLIRNYCMKNTSKYSPSYNSMNQNCRTNSIPSFLQKRASAIENKLR